MKRILPAALILWTSASAWAQLTTVTLQSNNASLASGSSLSTEYGGFHREACLQGSSNDFDDFTLEWSPQAATTTYQVFGDNNDATCTLPDEGDGGVPNELSVGNETVSPELQVNTTQLLQQATDNTDICNSSTSGILYLCIQLSIQEVGCIGCSTSVETSDFTLAIPYDMSPPPAPTGFSVAPDDSSLDLSWNFTYDDTTTDNYADNADHFVVYYQQDTTVQPSSALGNCPTPAAFAGDAGTPDVSSWRQAATPTPDETNVSYTIGGLTNGLCYDVAVQAYYSDGTAGILTPVQTFAPIEVWDYWRLYHAAGGQDVGGAHCQSVGGGLVPIGVVLIGLFWLSQRRRRAR